MDYLTDESPQSCISRLETYFSSRWPYPGSLYRPTYDSIRFSGRVRRTAVEIFGDMLLFIISLGMRTPSALNQPTVEVFARAQGAAQTRLRVIANSNDYARTLDVWIKEDLGARPQENG